MSDRSSPDAATAGERRPPSHQDPLAAERRTMVIAAAAMVLLIAVGVVSAALFTGSACGDIDPAPLAAGTAGTDVPEVIAEAFPQLDAAAQDALVADVSVLAERLGAVVGVADVGHAERLTDLTTGPAALGPTTTALDPGGSAVAAAGFAEPAEVVGGGGALYSVALVNQLTGQLDAVQPLSPDLEPVGACLDAATVNVPFAFHLDAGGGQLLVLRVDEDGGEPELELRDPQGALWQAPLRAPVAPPGLLGERLSARLGDDLVVGARRVVPGEPAPAVTAVGRGDGVERWSVPLDDLPVGDEPHRIEVFGVSDTLVVVGLAADDTPSERRLVGLDPVDGSVRWGDPAAADIVRVVRGRAGWIELVDAGEDLVMRQIDPDSGDRSELATVAGAAGGRAVVTPDAVVAALGDDGLVVVTAGDVRHHALQAVTAADVVADGDGRITLLVTQGNDGLALTFAAP